MPGHKPDHTPSHSRPRVCQFGSFPTGPEYSRNRSVARALEAAGWSVVECRAAGQASPGVEIRQGGGVAAMIRLAVAALGRFASLTRQHRSTPDYRAMVVGYPAHVDILLGSLLARLRGRPIVMDAFLGLYDTVVRDRKMLSARHPMAVAIWCWEWMALRLADAVLVDTPEQARLLADEFGLGSGRVTDVPVGIDEEIWLPTALPPPSQPFRVLSWGTFIPLHGMNVVAGASGLLAEASVPIALRVIGDGQTASGFAELLESNRNDGSPVEWERRFVELSAIHEAALQAHCCLGIFGSSAKANAVVPYKVYQALALGRPVITADTPAARRVLVDGVSALLIPPDSPAALARAIERLALDRPLCERLAEGGRRAYDEHLSKRAMSQKLADLMISLTTRS